MATKSTPKKTASTKAPARKKQAAKKSSKSTTLSSFRASGDSTPFLTLAITRQTLYWGILSFVVLVLGLWIIHLQNEINKIYDAIEISQSSIDTTPHFVKKKS